MYTKITSSPSSCCFNCNGRTGCQFTHSDLSSFLLIKRSRQLKNSGYHFLQFTSNYGASKVISLSSNLQARASSSSPPPSPSQWKKWLIGLLLTVILPAIGHKGGLFIALKGRIDKAIATVEAVTEVVEEMAEEAEKIMEEVEERLPGDSKLKETLDSFEDLAKKAVNEAKHAEDLIHKVKDVEEEIEGTLIKTISQKESSKDQDPAAKR